MRSTRTGKYSKNCTTTNTQRSSKTFHGFASCKKQTHLLQIQTRALPYLHCGGEKGKPCTYFETLCLCHMSSARSSSDGRGPVTRTRVPDRDEQGKPGNDARRGRCHLLEAGFWPLWMTPLPRYATTKYQVPCHARTPAVLSSCQDLRW